MELAQYGIPLPFEVTYDNPSLNVGMSVYDVTTGSAVLVSGPTLMSLVAINTYRGVFTALENHNYIVIKAVYTDGTLATVDSDYYQGSESIAAIDLESGGGGGGTVNCGAVVGFIQDPPIVGIVDNSGAIIGLVAC